MGGSLDSEPAGDPAVETGGQASAVGTGADEPDPGWQQDFAGVPFTQRRSKVLDTLREYRAGELTWPHTLDILVNFRWATPTPPEGSPMVADPSHGTWAQDVEDSVGAAPEPNTWSEMDEALAEGLITEPEYDDVLRGVIARSEGTGVDTLPGAAGPQSTDSGSGAETSDGSDGGGDSENYGQS